MIGIGANLFKVAMRLGSGFSPASLFDNGERGAWYDPSDLSSMFQSSDGTTPAVVDSPVGYIRDKSGNGHHMIQVTDADRPVLKKSDGLYYLEFDGANWGMQTGSTVNFDNTDEMNVVVGVSKEAATTQTVIESSDTAYATNGTFRIFGNNTLWKANTRTSSTGEISISKSEGVSTKVLTMINKVSTPLLQFRVNGSAVTAVTTAQGGGNYGDKKLNLGARANAASKWLDGNIYGLIIRNIVPNAAELASMESYMNDKTGV